MPKNVLIVGMPRSGTSLSANVFVNQGYFVSEDSDSQLRHSDIHNPFGYFEAEMLIENNVDIFKAAGFPHHNTWKFDAITDEQANKIDTVAPIAHHMEFIKSQNARSPWVWKDPRLCYTLAYWWKLVDQRNTAILLLTRNKEDIYQSFVRVGWRKDGPQVRDEVYKRIEAHWKFAEDTVNKYNIPHIKVDYSEYIDSANSVAKKISQFFDLELGADDLNVRKDLNHGNSNTSVMTSLGRRITPYPRLRKLCNALLPRILTDKLFPEQKYVPDKG